MALFPADPPRRGTAETGGDPTLRNILDVCGRAMRPSGDLNSDAGSKHMDEIEGELAALLHPEKERLQANMTQAISCMLDLVYPPSDSYLLGKRPYQTAVSEVTESRCSEKRERAKM